VRKIDSWTITDTTCVGVYICGFCNVWVF